MRIFCISDLHLGDGGKADDFTGETFLKCFLSLLMPEDYLVLVGDILDLKQFSLNEVIEAYGNLLTEIFMRNNIIYVAGNHDIKMLGKEFYGVTVVDKFIIDDILFIHGHQFDWLNNQHYWMVDWALKALRYMEEKINKDIDIKLDRLLKYGRWADTDKKYKKMAFQLIKDMGLKKIVMGHTHRKGMWFDGDYTYYNDGCWVNGKTNYICLYKEDTNEHQ